MPLRTFWKLKRRNLHNAIHLRSVGDMYSLVYRKARDLPKLMVAVRAKRTDTVGGESRMFREFMIDGFKVVRCIVIVVHKCCYTFKIFCIYNLLRIFSMASETSRLYRATLTAIPENSAVQPTFTAKSSHEA